MILFSDGRICASPGTEEQKPDSCAGYSLIELIVTVVILGLVVASFASFGSGILVQSAENDELAAAIRIARSRMEEAAGMGTGLVSTGWVASSSYEWRRQVDVLRADPNGPTLVEVRVYVRNSGGLICSLMTHIAE